jgi:hypothetical protein
MAVRRGRTHVAVGAFALGWRTGNAASSADAQEPLLAPIVGPRGVNGAGGSSREASCLHTPQKIAVSSRVAACPARRAVVLFRAVGGHAGLMATKAIDGTSLPGGAFVVVKTFEAGGPARGRRLVAIGQPGFRAGLAGPDALLGWALGRHWRPRRGIENGNGHGGWWRVVARNRGRGGGFEAEAVGRTCDGTRGDGAGSLGPWPSAPRERSDQAQYQGHRQGKAGPSHRNRCGSCRMDRSNDKCRVAPRDGSRCRSAAREDRNRTRVRRGLTGFRSPWASPAPPIRSHFRKNGSPSCPWLDWMSPTRGQWQ